MKPSRAEISDLISKIAQSKRMAEVKIDSDCESSAETLDRCLVDPILRRDPLIQARAKSRLDSNYKLQPEHDYDGLVCDVHW